MAIKAVRYRKPLKFVSGVEKAVETMPADVQDAFGKALAAAQCGDPVPGARPFGEGVPRDVLKLVENDDGETYRATFVVAFAGVVYMLDVFQKKSKSGKATPQPDLDRVTARYHARCRITRRTRPPISHLQRRRRPKRSRRPWSGRRRYGRAARRNE